MLSLKFFKGVIPAALIISAFSVQLFAFGEADSVVFQNDSVFTIESVQKELGTEGEWIKVTKDEIDPEAVADASGGIDPDINTDYIWRPYGVAEGWSPYTNGYWTYTNCGWMWVSYYSWGWRTTHYGRWWWHARWGWVWSPGYIWAPAWVVWIYNDYYCGWYPISPWVRWHHGYGYRCHNMRYKVRCWTYVEKKKFADPIPPIHPVIDPSGITEIVKTGVVDNNPYISKTGINTGGPKVKTIEDVTGKKQPVDDVTMYNNVDKYYGTKTDVVTKKKDDDTWKSNNTGVKKNDGNNNSGTKDNTGIKGNTGTKDNTGAKDNTGSKNDGWYKGNDGKKNNDSTKSYDGTKSNDGNKNNDGSKNNDTKKSNDSKNNNDGNKQYSPPPTKQYDPPKKTDPPKQYDPPKQEQPKQDPSKKDNSSKSNDVNKESKENGKK